MFRNSITGAEERYRKIHRPSTRQCEYNRDERASVIYAIPIA